MLNWIQFLPVVYVWTPKSKSDGSAAGLLWPEPEEASLEDPSSPEWYEDLEPEVIEKLAGVSVVWPEVPLVGDDILNGDGEVIGIAELTFEEARIALLLDDQVELKPELEGDGWSVYTEINALVAAINKQEQGV